MSNTPQQREKAVREVRVVKGGGGGDVGAVEGGDESGEEKVGSGEIWTIVKRVLRQLTIVKRVLRQLTAGHRNIKKSQALSALSALDISPIKRSHLTSGVGMAAKLSKICDGINKTELNVEELLPIDC